MTTEKGHSHVLLPVPDPEPKKEGLAWWKMTACSNRSYLKGHQCLPVGKEGITVEVWVQRMGHRNGDHVQGQEGTLWIPSSVILFTAIFTFLIKLLLTWKQTD